MNKELHVSALHRAFAGSPSAGAGAAGPRCRSCGAARGSQHGAAGMVRGARRSPRDLRPGVPEGPPNTTEGLWALENLFGNSERTSLARIRFTNASSPTY